jgi:hypothetical protein
MRANRPLLGQSDALHRRAGGGSTARVFNDSSQSEADSALRRTGPPRLPLYSFAQTMLIDYAEMLQPRKDSATLATESIGEAVNRPSLLEEESKRRVLIDRPWFISAWMSTPDLSN